MIIPKTQELSDMILVEKTLRNISRIIKDNPRERSILLKELRKDCNVEYEGDHKELVDWLQRLEFEQSEKVQQKVIDLQCEHEYKKELRSKIRKPVLDSTTWT